MLDAAARKYASCRPKLAAFGKLFGIWFWIVALTIRLYYLTGLLGKFFAHHNARPPYNASLPSCEAARMLSLIQYVPLPLPSPTPS